MSILVTGGTGFIGSHLLRRLVAQGKLVSATKRRSTNMHLVKDIADKITWFDTDILDIEGLTMAMSGIKQVYHCAAVVSFVPSEHAQMHQVNATGTANVVNIALATGVEKMLYVSSIAALGRSALQQNVNENSKWEDSPYNTQYAISKMLGEREVWRGIEEGLKAVIINPSVVLGEGDWTQSSGRLFKRVYDGLRFYPQGGTGYVDVLDVTTLATALMDSPLCNERYVVNAQNMTYKAFFDTVAQYLGKPAPYIAASELMAQIAWRIEAIRCKISGAKPLITRETANMTKMHYFYQNDKICKALSFQFTPIEQTIKRVCEALRHELDPNYKHKGN
jgi:dihydroflavonol-4-reductase